MTGLRIGLLGAARISVGSVIAPAHRGDHRLVVVAARDVDRAEAYAAEHGIERVAATYDDVIADPDVELVYNPLANSLHAPWNIKALRAGKHVLSEKPFAANGVEARRVAEVARQSDGVVMEAFHYAMHPVMQRVLEIVASGEIGEVRHIGSTMVIPAPADDDLRWSFELAGGAMMDLGCYSLHAMRLLGAAAGGEPVVRSAIGGERTGHPGVDEWIRAELDYPAGATGSLLTHMAGPDVVMTLTVVGSTGRVEVRNFVLPTIDDRIDVTTTDGTRTEALGTRASYDYQLDAMTAAIHDGAPLPLDLDDAIATMDLIDATYVAAGFTPRPSSLD
ncbi:MAG: Gfo/Idh/MocA family oxidoreductase [Aeromicrobium sp.]